MMLCDAAVQHRLLRSGQLDIDTLLQSIDWMRSYIDDQKIMFTED
jgi:hypothetical protein